jgi:hypothetical protein
MRAPMLTSNRWLPLVIIIAILLIGVYVVSAYLIPKVICKIVPRTSVKLYAGKYNPNVFSDICSAIT